jgi:hypothetical protein
MPNVAPLQKTHLNDDEVAPLVAATSFVPEIDSETHWNEIANVYVNFTGGKRTKARLGKGVENCRDHFGEPCAAARRGRRRRQGRHVRLAGEPGGDG